MCVYVCVSVCVHTLEEAHVCVVLRRTRAHLLVWWTKLNFVGVFPKSGKDQWDCKIGNYYVALSGLTTVMSIHTLRDDTVAKACVTLRNLSWFTRLFLLARGSDLETRLVCVMNKVESLPHKCNGWRDRSHTRFACACTCLCQRAAVTHVLYVILVYRRSGNFHVKNNLHKKFSC